MTESIQKKLLNIRPPRVKITYDVHTAGSIEKKELPFNVLSICKQRVLADFELGLGFEQCELFKQLDASANGTYGGQPVSLLVADFEIASGTKDIEFLIFLSKIASTAHAPLIVAITPEVTDASTNAALETFKQLESSRYVVKTPSIEGAQLLAKHVEVSYLQHGWVGQFERASPFFPYQLLPYLLAASRFAQYVKVIVRDKVGSFMTRGNVESYLNTWISQYVLLADNAPEEANAAFPLRAANIVVTEVAGSPGTYQATIFIKPHYQLEELTTSIRLVASLPS